MAPSKGPSKGVSQHRSTGSVGRSQTPVKPVIPLPHTRRQAAAKATASTTAAGSTNTSTVTSPKSDQSGEAPASPGQIRNHAPGDATPVAPRAQPVKRVNGASHVDQPMATTSDAPSAASESASSPSPENPSASNLTERNAERADGLEVDYSHRSQNANPADQERLNGASGRDESQTGGGQLTHPSRIHHNGPERYQLPPAFHPSNQSVRTNPAENIEMPRPQMGYNGPPSRVHQSHASNGSLHFGAFHESASSSPAPPHSGGIMPPPGMQFPNARPSHMGPPSHGFPPGLPPTGTPPNVDVYGRPLPVHDPYLPGHNYQSSLSSTHADENGMFPQDGRSYMPGPGGEVHPRQYYSAPSGPRAGPMMGHHTTPSNAVPHGDERVNFDFLQHHFSNAQFADCEIQLRHQDKQGLAKIPAHRLVLSRSAVLNDLMKGTEQHLPQSILLDITSKWVSIEACYLALQHLYGHPLFAPPPNRPAESNGLQPMGSAIDRLKFALAYAAAGHLIGCEPVLRRGCEIAAGLVDLETIEIALEFALEGFRDAGVYDEFKYQDGSRIILHSIVSFVAANLPQGFSLDTLTVKNIPYARLPIAAPPSSPPAHDSDSPVIARGHSGAHLRKSSLSHAGIQFGDLSLSGGENNSSYATPRASQQLPPAFSILSRVLLNLPFAHLKMLLDTFPMAAAGNAPYLEFGYRVVAEVIQERERRRAQVVEAIVKDPTPDNEPIRSCLQSPEPRYPEQWSILGWQEEFDYTNSSPQQRPRLNRRWSPLRTTESDRSAAPAYP